MSVCRSGRWAQCPGCGQARAVNQSGRLRVHQSEPGRSGARPPCPGSGAVPEVPGPVTAAEAAQLRTALELALNWLGPRDLMALAPRLAEVCLVAQSALELQEAARG